MAPKFSVSDDSAEEGAHHIAAAFESLVDHFDRLLMLHAGDVDVVGPLERVQALRDEDRSSRESCHANLDTSCSGTGCEMVALTY
jgi:hypothetical protein